MYGYEGLCKAMYGYVGLCTAVYGYVGLLVFWVERISKSAQFI